MVQKIYSKMHPVSCTNTHHDVTDLVNHGVVENTKTWISWEQNTTFLRNKKILKLCLRWQILRSQDFEADVTFKIYTMKWNFNLQLLRHEFNPLIPGKSCCTIRPIFFLFFSVNKHWSFDLGLHSFFCFFAT